MVILGMGCKAQVGKDTAADYLTKNYSSFARVAFADKLKQICIMLFGLTYEQCYGSKEIKETIDPRYDMSPREILQKVGEGMRNIFPTIWVDTVFNTTIPELEKKGFHNFVISDVRFPNEANKLKEVGDGFVLRVDRSAGGTEVGSEHSSETAMSDYKHFDFIIDNNGTFEDYFSSIEKVLREVEWSNEGKVPVQKEEV